jgi:ATP-binding cassette subfamily G (WHITE) protein 2
MHQNDDSIIVASSGKGQTTAVNIELQTSTDEDSHSRGGKTLAERLANKYNESVWAQRCGEDLKPILADYLQRAQDGTETSIEGVHYATSFAVQLKHVARRTLLNLARNPQTSILQTAVNIFMGVIIGIIFLQMDLSVLSMQTRQGLLFFASINNMMGNLPAIEIFIRERVIFVHESASGFYRVSAYFVSKVLCDLIPMRIIPLTCYCIIVYFMTGLQMQAGKFFLFYLDLFLVTMCSSAIAFTVSATVGVFAIANLLCVLIFIIMMIFGGLLVNIGHLGDWIRWLQWLSVIRYSLNTLMINEMKELTFHDTDNSTTTGVQFLNRQAIAHDTMWEKWQNIMALILIAIGIMCLAYIQLRRIKKVK